MCVNVCGHVYVYVAVTVAVGGAVVVLVCSRLCVCVDSFSLDTISRGAWAFLIGRVTCLSDLVSVRAVKKKEREKQKEREEREKRRKKKGKETCKKRDTHIHNTTCTHITSCTHNTTCTHKRTTIFTDTHTTAHFLLITVTSVTPVTSVIFLPPYRFRFNIKL